MSEYKFSNKSKDALETCHYDLQTLFNEVIKFADCSILEGYRTEEKQNRMMEEGKSKLSYPNSKHNTNPSLAIDVVPFPVPDWEKLSDFYYFAGFVKGIADSLYKSGRMTYKIRCGADWGQNYRVSDETFSDLIHYELVK